MINLSNSFARSAACAFVAVMLSALTLTAAVTAVEAAPNARSVQIS
jgi:hypothetical protein